MEKMKPTEINGINGHFFGRLRFLQKYHRTHHNVPEKKAMQYAIQICSNENKIDSKTKNNTSPSPIPFFFVAYMGIPIKTKLNALLTIVLKIKERTEYKNIE